MYSISKIDDCYTKPNFTRFFFFFVSNILLVVDYFDTYSFGGGGSWIWIFSCPDSSCIWILFDTFMHLVITCVDMYHSEFSAIFLNLRWASVSFLTEFL